MEYMNLTPESLDKSTVSLESEYSAAAPDVQRFMMAVVKAGFNDAQLKMLAEGMERVKAGVPAEDALAELKADVEQSRRVQ